MSSDRTEETRGYRVARFLFKLGGAAIVLGLIAWLLAIWTPVMVDRLVPYANVGNRAAWPSAHGFDVPLDHWRDRRTFDYYATLTNEWRDYLRRTETVGV